MVRSLDSYTVMIPCSTKFSFWREYIFAQGDFFRVLLQLIFATGFSCWALIFAIIEKSRSIEIRTFAFLN